MGFLYSQRRAFQPLALFSKLAGKVWLWPPKIGKEVLSPLPLQEAILELEFSAYPLV